MKFQLTFRSHDYFMPFQMTGIRAILRQKNRILILFLTFQMLFILFSQVWRQIKFTS